MVISIINTSLICLTWSYNISIGLAMKALDVEFDRIMLKSFKIQSKHLQTIISTKDVIHQFTSNTFNLGIEQIF